MRGFARMGELLHTSGDREVPAVLGGKRLRRGFAGMMSVLRGSGMAYAELLQIGRATRRKSRDLHRRLGEPQAGFELPDLAFQEAAQAGGRTE